MEVFIARELGARIAILEWARVLVAHVILVARVLEARIVLVAQGLCARALAPVVGPSRSRRLAGAWCPSTGCCVSPVSSRRARHAHERRARKVGKERKEREFRREREKQRKEKKKGEAMGERPYSGSSSRCEYHFDIHTYMYAWANN